MLSQVMGLASCLAVKRTSLNLSGQILTNVIIGLACIIYIDILFAACCLLAF